MPTFQPEQKKTALAFHAKDDLPEIRREVFKILPQLGGKVQVIIRTKAIPAREAQALYRYRRRKLNDNDVYDDLVMRLFRNMRYYSVHSRNRRF